MHTWAKIMFIEIDAWDSAKSDLISMGKNNVVLAGPRFISEHDGHYKYVWFASPTAPILNA